MRNRRVMDCEALKQADVTRKALTPILKTCFDGTRPIPDSLEEDVRLGSSCSFLSRATVLWFADETAKSGQDEVLETSLSQWVTDFSDIGHAHETKRTSFGSRSAQRHNERLKRLVPPQVLEQNRQVPKKRFLAPVARFDMMVWFDSINKVWAASYSRSSRLRCAQ